MVRLKQRYILFDILYPPQNDQDPDFVNFSNSPQEALIAMCQSSPASVNQKLITQVIRKVLQDHYGDMGAGAAGMLISVKYFNNKTSTGILRCSRQSFQLVMSSLTLMNRISNREVIVRCLHVSGTIKRCEEFAIKRNHDIMLQLKNIKSTGVDVLLGNFASGDDVIEMEDNDQD